MEERGEAPGPAEVAAAVAEYPNVHSVVHIQVLHAVNSTATFLILPGCCSPPFIIAFSGKGQTEAGDSPGTRSVLADLGSFPTSAGIREHAQTLRKQAQTLVSDCAGGRGARCHEGRACSGR